MIFRVNKLLYPTPTMRRVSSHWTFTLLPSQYQKRTFIPRRYSVTTPVPARDEILQANRPKDLVSPSPAPLAKLPIGIVIRSLLISQISCTPWLLSPSIKILSFFSRSSGRLFHVDRNPVIRFILRYTVYDQFCAGVTPAEVAKTILKLKSIGYTGVILSFARETLLTREQLKNLDSVIVKSEETKAIETEVRPWKEGVLKTVELSKPGDHVSLKFTGAGRLALYYLSRNLPCPPGIQKAIDEICELALYRGVSLLIDAEQSSLQPGIDQWTLFFSQKFNTQPDKICIYNTYQAYLKATPGNILAHLERAKQEGFTLGIKLVRGAYLSSDPRDLIFETKEDTDNCYNQLAKALLCSQWSSMLPGKGAFPSLHLILATHNAESVQYAKELLLNGNVKNDVSFAQLQGMADEVSAELLDVMAQWSSRNTESHLSIVPSIKSYKYLTWGSVHECMEYLIRRAQENKDAVTRTRRGRDAMWVEVKRRIWNLI